MIFGPYKLWLHLHILEGFNFYMKNKCVVVSFA